MTFVKRFFAFWLDFTIGDDRTVAAGVTRTRLYVWAEKIVGQPGAGNVDSRWRLYGNEKALAPTPNAKLALISVLMG